MNKLKPEDLVQFLHSSDYDNVIIGLEILKKSFPSKRFNTLEYTQLCDLHVILNTMNINTHVLSSKELKFLYLYLSNLSMALNRKCFEFQQYCLSNSRKKLYEKLI